MAGLAALCHARRSDISLRGDEVTILSTHERYTIPLAVHHHPVTKTFSMFQSAEQTSETWVTDAMASDVEELLGFTRPGVAQCTEQLRNMSKTFLTVDCLHLEMNPLAETPQGQVRKLFRSFR